MSTDRESPKRALPPVYVFVAVILMTCLHLLVPVRRFVEGSYRYLGIVLLLAGFGTVLWAAMLFRRAGTTIRPFERSSALVVRGPYRLTRNPIYVAMTAGLTGIAVLFGSLTPFLVVPLFVYLIDRRFIRAEEAMLEEALGADYSAYKTRVRRWL